MWTRARRLASEAEPPHVATDGFMKKGTGGGDRRDRRNLRVDQKDEKTEPEEGFPLVSRHSSQISKDC